MMPKHDLQYSSNNHQDNQNNFIPNKKTKKFDLYQKIKMARLLLFWSPIVHIATSIIFLILLLVGTLSHKLGFEFNNIELALSLSYIGIAILISVICFMVPAKKVKKKSWFRIIAISTLILSTLILSGSLYFWLFPTLLFFSLVTLCVWVAEILAAIILIFVVEELPNQK